MCGRYAFDPKDFQEFFDAYGIKTGLKKFEPHYNVFPTMRMPVIADKEMKEVELMRWGFIPFWVSDYKTFRKPLINARSEGIEDKPAFRRAIRTKRCLVLTNGFYEWSHLTAERTPFFIKLRGQNAFFFAGIWDENKDAGGLATKSFAIITTSPNRLLEKIHDRMPVIMDDVQLKKWVDPETPLEEVLTVLRPYDEEKMEAYPISRLINKHENDTKDIILPAPKQPEQKEFF